MISLIRNLGWESKLTPVLKKTAADGGESLCRVLIELTGSDSEPVKAAIARNAGLVCAEMNRLPMLVAEVSTAALSELAGLKQVKKIREDHPVKLMDGSEHGK
jgi:hypothetical protein